MYFLYVFKNRNTFWYFPDTLVKLESKFCGLNVMGGSKESILPTFFKHFVYTCRNS